jgi:hypothetical protein
VRDVRVAQLLQRFDRQRGPSATSAIQDRAPFWDELWAMIVVSRVRVELEHSAGRVNGTRDGSLLGSLLGFAQVNQQYAAAFELGGDLIWCEVLAPLLGIGDHLRRRLCSTLH